MDRNPNWLAERSEFFSKNALKWFPIIFSKTFERGFSREIGLHPLPFLGIGTTSAVFHAVGNWPESMQRLKSVLSGYAMESPHAFSSSRLISVDSDDFPVGS